MDKYAWEEDDIEIIGEKMSHYNHKGRPGRVGGSLPRGSTLSYLFEKLKGGKGSGNMGHAGNPGHRGGSAPAILGAALVGADTNQNMHVELYKLVNGEFQDHATVEKTNSGVKITWWQFGEPNGHERYSDILEAYSELHKMGYKLSSENEVREFESQVSTLSS